MFNEASPTFCREMRGNSFHIPDFNIQSDYFNNKLQSQTENIIKPMEEELDFVENIIKNLRKLIANIQRAEAKHEMIFGADIENEIALTKLNKLIVQLKLFWLHLDFVLEILTNKEEFITEEIAKRYNVIGDSYTSIKKKEDLCLLMLDEVLQNIGLTMINEVDKVLDKFFVLQDDGTFLLNTDLDFLDCVEIVSSKLETINEYFPLSVSLTPDDIFSHRKTTEIWKRLHGVTETINLGDKEAIRNQLKITSGILSLGASLASHNDLFNSTKITDKAMVVWKGFYYSVKPKEAEIKANLYLTNPNMDSAFTVWKLPENPVMNELLALRLPTIDYDRKLYLHRLFPSITKETILKEYEDGTLTTIQENNFKPVDLGAKKDTILESIFKKQDNAVKVRIICPYPLILQGQITEITRATFMKHINKVTQFIKKDKSQTNTDDSVIIHIHGGGFVSGSSSSHRSYLYRWAKRLNKVIFSIDYRLAPDHPYPAALDDVWQAYNWIINYAEPILGIKTNKVIVAGDSAGGNLAMALTLRCIKMGVRIPDGCLLVYPALNTYLKRFAPSYLLALEDPILPYSILKLCIRAYIPEEFKPMIDPFLSPIAASDEMLSKLPAVKIITGTTDPLHDDNWRFVHRMLNLEKNVKVVAYENMPHGFMSFDNMLDYKAIIETACKCFEELMGMSPSTQSKSPETNSPPELSPARVEIIKNFFSRS